VLRNTIALSAKTATLRKHGGSERLSHFERSAESPAE
jgi:hypothetical protein